LLQQKKKQLSFGEVQEASYKVVEPTVRAEGLRASVKALLMAFCKGIVQILLHSEAARKIS
jgi:hypothetical protein